MRRNRAACQAVVAIRVRDPRRTHHLTRRGLAAGELGRALSLSGTHPGSYGVFGDWNLRPESVSAGPESAAVIVGGNRLEKYPDGPSEADSGRSSRSFLVFAPEWVGKPAKHGFTAAAGPHRTHPGSPRHRGHTAPTLRRTRR